MRKAKLFGMLLPSLGLLSACVPIQQSAPIAVEKLCHDWRHGTISKDDKLTEGTASQIEALNKSRPAWGCAYGQNEAQTKAGNKS